MTNERILAAALAARSAALAATEITFSVWKDSQGERGDDAHMQAIDAYRYACAEVEAIRAEMKRPQSKQRKYVVRIEFTLPDMGIDDEYIAQYVADILSESRLGEHVDAVTDASIMAHDVRIVAVGTGCMTFASNAVTQ
jgi:hypothetical protein